MANPLIALFEKNGAGTRPFRADDDETCVTLETCRIQPGNFCTRQPRDSEPSARVTVRRQMTIDTVDLPADLQKHGYLSGFIAYLFSQHKLDAVQLRAVLNVSFREYLLASPRWVCQDRVQKFEEWSNPSFVMFKE